MPGPSCPLPGGGPLGEEMRKKARAIAIEALKKRGARACGACGQLFGTPSNRSFIPRVVEKLNDDGTSSKLCVGCWDLGTEAERAGNA